MRCSTKSACMSFIALMTEGIVKFKDDIFLSPEDGPFKAFFIEGRILGQNRDGSPIRDAFVLNYCPACGTQFRSFIGSYSPPLEAEKPERKPPTLGIITSE